MSTDLDAARAELDFPDDHPVVRGRSIAERADDPVAVVEGTVQESFFDEEVVNELLEVALEKRQVARERLKPAKKAYDEAHATVNGIIAGLGLGQDLAEDDVVTYRCGRFRIKRAYRKGTPVSFETSPSTRTTISVLYE